MLEHWRGAGGGEGKSLFFVSGDGTWKQVWVTGWAPRPGGVKEKTFQATGSTDEGQSLTTGFDAIYHTRK